MKKVTTVILLLITSMFLNFNKVSESAPFFTTAICATDYGVLMAQKGAKRLDLYNVEGKIIRSFPLSETPTGIIADGRMAYVTTFDTEGSLLVLDLETGETQTSIITGSGACSPTLSADKSKLYVCNQFANTLSEVDIQQKKVSRTVRVLREPKGSVMSADGKYLFVTNYLPAQKANVDIVTSCVSVIEMQGFTKIKDIPLANGSNALRAICITPDGKYVYVSHNLGRFQVPTSQLQQGWMNTSAFSIIDVAQQNCLGTVIVDEPDKGAAGVWGLACNNDFLFVSHSGTHEISVIDHQAMLKKFEAYSPKEALSYDLNFLYGIRKRIPITGNGPRDMILYNDQLVVPTYFSDILNIMDISTQDIRSINVNVGRKETIENEGERYFNDASYCFQGWQSCNGCHPGDARTDGMNWDLLNDGVGNPKNCKSMLYAHITAPSMITGVRESAELAVRKGFTHIQFSAITEEQASAVDAYLKALRPVASPYLQNGELSALAKEGRKVFDRLDCGSCHSGPYFTDRKMHRIGENIEFEKGWDTPTLVEVWRTAPYLFDGRAANLNDVFEIEKHGIPQKISKQDIAALVEYVNSL